MKKTLYFICPTDNLEHLINNKFMGENYFYTSLGNSISFGDKDVVGQMNQLIQTEKINSVAFILSEDNRILLDAIGKRKYSDIQGLNLFQEGILEKKQIVELFWGNTNLNYLIQSYHLNTKIKELCCVLNQDYFEKLTIIGKIYNKTKGEFIDIYSDLVCKNIFSLN